MSSSSLQHDSASCALCEDVPPDAYRRHWKRERRAGYWHTIADGPKLVGRLPRQAHFLTILAYRSGVDGSSAHYWGPFYGECDAEDPAQAFTDLRRCVELLHREYDCPLEAIHVWHSGSRGPHWTIPPMIFGAEAGHPLLPRIYAAMIDHLFPDSIAPTLDRGIYSSGKGRMWRLPNRLRTDTGRYKVPVTIREALHTSYADLEAFTRRPRRGIFWPVDAELSPCTALVQLYHETAAAIERRGIGERSTRRPHRNACGHEGLLFHAFASRDWIGEALEPGKWAVVCPWEGQHTKGEMFDSSTILFAPGDGEVLGWFHCSHAHCQGRDVRDVLALFSRAEFDQAATLAGVNDRTVCVKGGLRTIDGQRIRARGGLPTIHGREVRPWV
jgi:hypothetical protein